MSQLVRLVYASRSTFSPSAGHQGLDPGVARILAKSRKNNAMRGIVGALLFGDGCFLQCLEGKDGDVDALYDKIRTDPRHRDVQVLSRRVVDRTSFGEWSMKYAPGEEPLRRFIGSLGMTRFDPYAMSPGNIDAVVAYMERGAESMPPQEGAGRKDSPARKGPPPSGKAPGTGQADAPAGGRSALGPAAKAIIGALVVAVLLGLGLWALRR